VIRKLTKQGNSTCLVIERPLRELLDIDTNTLLKISVEGRRLIIEPLTEKDREGKFRKALADTKGEFAPALKRLAK
jgi:antitoxin MazE